MLVEMLSNVGLLSAASLLIFLIVVRTGVGPGDLRVSLATGLALGVVAVLVVKVPVTVAGASFDTRAAPVVLSGIVGGPAAALVAATIAALARYDLGGPSVGGGVASCVVYGAIGCGVGWMMRRLGRDSLGPLGLIAVGIASVVVVVPVFFVGIAAETGLSILQRGWPMLLAGNVSGILLLGLMIEELQRFLRERDSLRRARESAVAGLEAKSRFISAVSHDMRTPLNGILGILQILDRDDLATADRKRVVMARRAGQYLLDLVNQILDFARIESGVVDFTSRFFTIGQLSDSLSSLFQPVAVENGLRLDLRIDDIVDTRFEGDYDHLRQVLFNLVGNALRYTREGSVVVRASVDVADADVVTVTFSVEDTGPGVPEADRERIFEQFIRLDDTAGATQGSGLGLSISRMLVAQMGGRLELESALGIGSRFFFTLPLRRAPAGAILDAGTEADPTAVGGLNLLVVDDVELNRMLLEDGLSRLGHLVETASSGVDAVALLAARPTAFDAVLMDIQMPGLNGDAATRKIRASIAEARDLPIIAVTANAFADQRERYLAAGMTAVVTKPVDFMELNRHLALLFGTAQAAPAPGPVERRDESGEDCLVDAGQFAALKCYLSVDRVPDLLERALGQLETFVGTLEAEPSPVQQARVAHQIKGTAANFGLTRLSRAAALVETTASRGDPAGEEIGALKAIMPSTRRAVQALVAGTDS